MGLMSIKICISTLLLNCLLASTLSHAQFSQQDLNTKIGQAIFEKLWVFAPASTKSSDGLGPFYNARSCQQCHNETKKTDQDFPTSLVIQLSIEPSNKGNQNEASLKHLKETGFIPEPTYGKQLQTFAYPGAYAEGYINAKKRNKHIQFRDGESVNLHYFEYSIKHLAYGTLHPNTHYSVRVAPRMINLGLLDQIPDASIEASADPDDINQDGISGKVNTVWNPETQSNDIGRFGWKAAKASLNQQNLAALSTDIGISSWLFPNPEGDCTAHQHHCVTLAQTSETHLSKNPQHNRSSLPEATKDMTDLLLAFTRNMGIHSPLSFNAQAHKEGERLFSEIGCVRCHQARFNIETSNSQNSTQTHSIWPYSDLLLHDMGIDLSDNRKEFQASGQEWRTAPLWGIAEYLRQIKVPHFLHDGRANSVLDAILWHGGEAKSSNDAFKKLTQQQRTHVIEFVEAL